MEQNLIHKIIRPFGRNQELIVTDVSGGQQYHIYLDNFYIGSLHHTCDGWRVALQHEGSLPQVYCDVIIAKVESI